MTPGDAILIAVLLPLVGAILIALTGATPNLREAVTLVVAALLFANVLTLVPVVLDGGRPTAVLVQMLPGVALAFEVEPLGMIFAMVASGLWIVTSI